MGSCWSTNRTEQLEFSSTMLTNNLDLQLQKLTVDGTNSLVNSYEYLEKNTFKKRIYDWRSIPFMEAFHFEFKTSFEVKNAGIKENNFVVGVIKKSAINLLISLPWRTQYCICYQSHQQMGESGVIYQGNLLRMGEGIKQGQTVKVVVSISEIQWKVNKKTLASIKLPQGFCNDDILPYVALFNPGDTVQFVNKIELGGKNHKN